MTETDTTRFALLFDFDGVLADSFEACYGANVKALGVVHRSMTRDEFRTLFHGNIHQGFRTMIQEDALFQTFSEAREKAFYEDYPKKVHLFSFIPDMLRNLSSRADIAIVSSNREAIMMKLLRDAGVDSCVRRIFANNRGGKEAGIRAALAALDTVPERSVFITDTRGDIDVAHSVGIKTIAVTWGFHSEDDLRKSKPDFVAREAFELVAYIQKLCRTTQ